MPALVCSMTVRLLLQQVHQRLDTPFFLLNHAHTASLYHVLLKVLFFFGTSGLVQKVAKLSWLHLISGYCVHGWTWANCRDDLLEA